jgi:uncharacterized protein (TIGR03118 family)
MRKSRSYLAWLAAGAGAMALAGCGGGGSSGSSQMASPAPAPAPTPTPTASVFANTALVSNTAAGTVDNLPSNTVATGDDATFTFPKTVNPQLDPDLSHGWGVAFGPGSPVWVNDHASNKSSLYDGNGNLIPSQPAVAIPANAKGAAAGPTGIVANINTMTCTTIAAAGCTPGTGFATGAGPALFIFDGTGGTISAWAAGATAITEFDGSAQGDVFTGLGIYTQPSNTTFLLAADFAHGVVDVFDSSFKQNTTAFPGGFVDPTLPTGYAPFGIQTIGALIYVSYAKQPPGPGPEVDGPGLGLVAVFDGTGKLVKELVPVGGPLNAPWGMAVAPAGFGSFGGDLLVGNFGDGRINVFDPNTGAMLGTLTNTLTNKPIHIPGLWGLAFGNGALNQSATTLYYAAGPDMKTQGLYGAIAVAAAATPSTSPTPPPTPIGGY